MLTVERNIPWKNVNEVPAPDASIPGVEVDEKGNVSIKVEIVTAESLEEAVNDAGGDAKLVEAYNDNKVNRALTNGRNLIRNAKKGSAVAELVGKAISAVKLFSFATAGDRIGVKQRAENATSALDFLKSLSAEDLAKMDVASLRERVLSELGKK